MQDKDTINYGDSLRDIATREIRKQKVIDLYNGPVETDKSIKSFDFTISEKTALKLFNVRFSGTVKLGFGMAAGRECKNISDLYIPFNADYYVHVRRDCNDDMIALVIPQEKMAAYFAAYYRKNPTYDKYSKCYKSQFNIGAHCPVYNSKKWNDLVSYTIGFGMLDKLATKTENLIELVNETGRNDSTTETSNRFNNTRKVGVPYGER